MNQKGTVRESVGCAEGHRGWSGGGSAAPVLCLLCGNPTLMQSRGLEWRCLGLGDLAELTEITCQDDRRLPRSQSQPRNWVCSISADHLSPKHCDRYPVPPLPKPWLDPDSIHHLASFPNEYFLCWKGCYQSLGIERFLIRSVIFLAKDWKIP